MTRSKRLFDLTLALLLLVPLVPLIAVIALIVALADGRPIFYNSERMREPGRAFRLHKFRTMATTAHDSGVTGGGKLDRITRTGHFLRRSRLDEVPQVWNILCGELSFVGPRPPLRQYVERFPEIYGEVLRSRPGVTGLASLKYRRHEEKLLLECKSAESTDSVYTRRCIPAKARLDLIYQRNRTLCMDAKIIMMTGLSVLRRQ